MNLSELISKLQEIEEEEGGDLICCTYDSVLEEYSENLCLEIVKDDYYLNIFDKKTYGEIILF